jgi:microcystin degradation protein MlrC
LKAPLDVAREGPVAVLTLNRPDKRNALSLELRELAAGALDELARLLLAPLDDSIDGAYVMLHGACVAHDDDDPEGRVLEELRARLGPGRPIVASLDCHANLTPRMVAAADAFTAYRTCPHVDTRRTGAQAGRILAAALAGEVRPVTAVASRPMITPPDLHDSSRDPFRRLMALNDEAEQEGALASCLLPVQPWIDVPGLSWKAVVTADGDRGLAARAVAGDGDHRRAPPRQLERRRAPDPARRAGDEAGLPPHLV